MSVVRLVVCDDDKMALETLRKICEKISADNGIDIRIHEYTSGSDLMFDLEDPKFHSLLDILLLDIHMPGLSGVDVAKEVRKVGYNGVIIFVTGSEEHYKDAFDVGALHYITKGESISRFQEIFLKAIDQSKENRNKEIVLFGWGELIKLKVKNIEYFEIRNKILYVFCDNTEYRIQGSLDGIERQLINSGFQRIHRSCLISLQHLKNISFQQVVMTNGTILPVGRKYYNGLKEAVNKLKL